MSSSREISVSDLLSTEAIILNLTESNKILLLQFLCSRMSKAYLDIDPKQFFLGIMKRENELSTGIGNHIAIPHTVADHTQKLHLLFTTHTGIEYDSLDGKPVRLIFMLAIPPAEKQLYSVFLMKVSQLMRISEFRDALIEAKTSEEVIELFKKYEKV
ncbi:MAG: PTS sugar transporter subunit IIA [Candidatus Cloacimonetes bacterium]|nr:PTS sugar transporter subunit IIA [Candidatus Cloacimonadota bacterium]